MKVKLLIISIVLFVSCKEQTPAPENTENKVAMEDTKATPLDISMYAEATNEQLRHIITLPKTTNDSDFKVELYVGKMAEVDCNKSTLAGAFNKETVSGWGYSYYNFETNGIIMSTQMMCPEDSKHQGFVKSTREMVRYNSKLPIVIYTPKGYEVRYKIWSRNANEQTAAIK